MNSLKDGKSELCRDLLLKAENTLLTMDKMDDLNFLGSSEAVNLKNKLLGLTYNNFGCLYK